MYASIVENWMNAECVIVPFSKSRLGFHVYEIIFKVNNVWFCSEFYDGERSFSGPVSFSVSPVDFSFVEDRKSPGPNWSYIELSKLTSVNFSFSSQFFKNEENKNILVTTIECIAMNSDNGFVEMERSLSSYPNALFLRNSSPVIH